MVLIVHFVAHAREQGDEKFRAWTSTINSPKPKQATPDVKPVLKHQKKKKLKTFMNGPIIWYFLIISFHQVEVIFMFMIDFWKEGERKKLFKLKIFKYLTMLEPGQ